MTVYSVCIAGWSIGEFGLAYGQSDATLSDPTRPPALIGESAAGAASAPVQSILQTVILGEGHRPMAVINGIMVGLGEKVGDATLVKLGESEAVLQGPAGRETLHLLPGLVKKMESSRSKQDEGMNHDK